MSKHPPLPKLDVRKVNEWDRHNLPRWVDEHYDISDVSPQDLLQVSRLYGGRWPFRTNCVFGIPSHFRSTLSGVQQKKMDDAEASIAEDKRQRDKKPEKPSTSERREHRTPTAPRRKVPHEDLHASQTPTSPVSHFLGHLISPEPPRNRASAGTEADHKERLEEASLYDLSPVAVAVSPVIRSQSRALRDAATSPMTMPRIAPRVVQKKVIVRERCCCQPGLSFYELVVMIVLVLSVIAYTYYR
uniref:LEM-like domain-containing protein n=1 Tax=Steinernema glaseri TaxID=37863 RepID=A0A1I7ZXA7_9BILA